MVDVVQNGNITPGHLAAWIAPGVIGDGGNAPAAQKVLARLTGADFNSTADQPLVLPSTMTAFMLTGIIVTNSTISLNTAVGGFYPQSSKGGTALVANTQVYSSLTSAAKLLSCTLAAGVSTTRYSRSNLPDWAIYLSLTTGQGQFSPADVYVLGIDLS